MPKFNPHQTDNGKPAEVITGQEADIFPNGQPDDVGGGQEVTAWTLARSVETPCALTMWPK